jgi:hypothetical protein
MTDRFAGVIVTFDRDIRDDDAEPLINAIRMLKGVIAVSPIEADPGHVIASNRVRRELQDKLRNWLEELS